MHMEVKWKISSTSITALLLIPGHLIVPDCFSPGHATHTCDYSQTAGHHNWVGCYQTEDNQWYHMADKGRV